MTRHIDTTLSEIEARIARVESQRRTAAEVKHRDNEIYRWFDESCPCNLPPGECKTHPRARANQRPPSTPWTQFCFLAGRGAGKSFSGAQWARSKAEQHPGCRLALVAPTAADARDIMVEGPSGVINICPPWDRPKYEPSKRRLTWRNGSIATMFSAEEPDRLRGHQNEFAWLDEVAAWDQGQHVFDMLLMGLRLGDNPQAFLTTTPRPSKFIKKLIADPMTIVSRGSSFDNKSQLPPAFFNAILSRYEGTRLGRQEIYAEVLSTDDGVWFESFDPSKHVNASAEWHPHFETHLAIDAGTSRHTAAVWFQVVPVDRYTRRVRVFGDYLSFGKFSEENARAIAKHGESLPCGNRIHSVRIDPASSQQTGIGVSAFSEYERVFGRLLQKAPGGSVTDTLDLMSCLLEKNLLTVHERCTNLVASFQEYKRAERAGEYIAKPAPDQTGIEDPMDALRYGIKSVFPEGRLEMRQFQTTHFLNLIG